MTKEELIEKDTIIADIIHRGYFYKALTPAIVKAIEETVFYVFDIERIENRKIKLTPASVSLKLGKRYISNAVFKLMKYEKNKTVAHSSKYFDNGNYTALKVFTDLKEAEDAYKIAIQESIKNVEATISVHERAITDAEAIKNELEDGSKMYI